MTDDADERATERVGSVLNDKWTLEKLIGVGGMAAVYAGLHRNGARAAIKVLHPSYARRPEVKERFLREGYAANRVNHSGVVKVLDDDEIVSGPDDGGAFLVMELLEGQSLEDRIERGPPIEERELLAIAAAVLDVLDAAHKADVVHRDLKPENLFLARDAGNAEAPPHIKILDFGLARVAEGNKTMAGLAIGTPSYMPPEQAAGRVHDIDGRSDLFALGASCFRILSGRTVHPADSALAICALMARDPAPKLRTVAPNVSAKGAAVIDRALAYRREDRWPTAADMRKAIDEAIADLGGDTIQIESGMIEVIEPPQAKVKDERPAGVPKRRSLLVWFTLLVLVAIGVKVGFDHLDWRSLLGEASRLRSDGDAPSTPSSVPSAATSATPGLPIDDLQIPEEPPVISPTTDAADVPDASSDPLDAAAEANVSDASHIQLIQVDAGRHHHDGGAHHPHGPHHR